MAKWALAIGAVGLAAGGATTFLLGASDHGEVDDAKSAALAGGKAPLTQVEAMGLVDDGETKKTIGVALFGGAGAAAVAAVLLFIADGDDPPPVALVPMGASIGVGGTF